MAITVLSRDPGSLLRILKSEIAANKIRTWSVDQDGDFTHTPPQWENKAWLRPHGITGKLIFTIIPPPNTKLEIETYAVYHGRFIEMLLAHVDTGFITASASALPESGEPART